MINTLSGGITSLSRRLARLSVIENATRNYFEVYLVRLAFALSHLIFSLNSVKSGN